MFLREILLPVQCDQRSTYCFILRTGHPRMYLGPAIYIAGRAIQKYFYIAGPAIHDFLYGETCDPPKFLYCETCDPTKFLYCETCDPPKFLYCGTSDPQIFFYCGTGDICRTCDPEIILYCGTGDPWFFVLRDLRSTEVFLFWDLWSTIFFYCRTGDPQMNCGIRRPEILNFKHIAGRAIYEFFGLSSFPRVATETRTFSVD